MKNTKAFNVTINKAIIKASEMGLNVIVGDCIEPSEDFEGYIEIALNRDRKKDELAKKVKEYIRWCNGFELDAYDFETTDHYILMIFPKK